MTVERTAKDGERVKSILRGKTVFIFAHLMITREIKLQFMS